MAASNHLNRRTGPAAAARPRGASRRWAGSAGPAGTGALEWAAWLAVVALGLHVAALLVMRRRTVRAVR